MTVDALTTTASSPTPPRADALLRYPCGPAPATGAAKEVAPGVRWLRLPLPAAKAAHINCWALRDGDGWAVVDTGMFAPVCVDAWNALLAADGALDGQPLTRVFATHMHSDHVGMAGWLTRRANCELWMTRTEYLSARLNVADAEREAPEPVLAFYRRAGWDEASLAQVRQGHGRFGKVTSPLPEGHRRLQDGQRLTVGQHEWQVVVGNGHSPEHACLYCPALKLLISGDQALPLVSSNVSVLPAEPHADPLHDWLSSLDKLRHAIADDVLVLPAHDDPFRGLHARLDSLAARRRRALDRTRQALAAAPQRAIDIVQALFGRGLGDWFVLKLATGEALAYLNWLLERGEATVRDDAAGVAWYAPR
ncbi:MAG: MBL fold metallo-hydrolase [Proteobacteria bacterium]|nr:MBL fold metallo-hydrolase [Pseudomonadota bacterium]